MSFRTVAHRPSSQWRSTIRPRHAVYPSYVTEHVPSTADSSAPVYPASVIAGSVLPLKRAEELLQTLPGVYSVRIIADESGAVEGIHVLTGMEVPAKQTVRNIESALVAHLGMRVDHRKISVATSLEAPPERVLRSSGGNDVVTSEPTLPGRNVYFEDVEVRRSRTKGVTCRVTLRRGDETYVGEAEGVEHDRAWIELAAQAALTALMKVGGEKAPLALYGAKQVDAFDREFVFVGVSAKFGRETVLLTGSCEVRDSAETASVLAVLDATNRWMAHAR